MNEDKKSPIASELSSDSFESAVDSILQKERQDEEDTERTNGTAKPPPTEALRLFYEQFGKFMECIKSFQDGEKFPYNFQSALEENINMDVKELEFMYKELRTVISNVDRLKNQGRAIRKEKNSVERILSKIEVQETQELEKIVLAHDKVMFSKWEIMKTSKDLTMIESLLNEIEGKYQALKILKLLLNRRMDEVLSNQIIENRKPKYHKRLDTFAATRKRARPRTQGSTVSYPARIDNSTNSSLFTPFISNLDDDVPVINNSMEVVSASDPTEIGSEIHIALNSLFGPITSTTTTTTTTTTASDQDGNSRRKITSIMNNSDIQLILTPIETTNTVPELEKP